MTAKRRIAVYCGSSNDVDTAYKEAATSVGRVLAQAEIGIVYGGGHVGLMGHVAEAALREGGEVIGVIPKKLQKRELAHNGLSQLHVVDTMHERKAMMADLANGYIALPGGWGTLEEIFEMMTWLQLGYHQNPVAILNTKGYYDNLLSFLEAAHQQGFVRTQHVDLVFSSSAINEVLEHVQSWWQRKGNFA